jgi:polyisoprenoid-binding protein YceI
MRKIFCWLVFFASVLQLEAQKFSVTKGEVSFASHAELELIKASSTTLTGIIDTSTNKLAFKVNNKSFVGFNSGLQREHFNEKYMESALYPASTFTGKVIEKVNYAVNGTYDVRVKGELDIHGQKQIRIIKGKLTVHEKSLSIETTFMVPLADHNISIPKIVSQKIATEIQVHLTATLVPNSGG